MSKEKGHVIRVNQWERSHFFLREKRGYPPPYPPFLTPFWRARGQARLPNQPESIREERLECFICVFFQDGDQSFTNQVWQGR